MHIVKIIAVVVSLSVMLSTAGCSVLGLTYEHADWLALRYAGRYVTFDDEQEQTLRSALRERLELHRREELSGYVAFLWNTEQMLNDGLTANEAGEFGATNETVSVDINKSPHQFVAVACTLLHASAIIDAKVLVVVLLSAS